MEVMVSVLTGAAAAAAAAPAIFRWSVRAGTAVGGSTW
jgi:hypothetical protein